MDNFFGKVPAAVNINKQEPEKKNGLEDLSSDDEPNMLKSMVKSTEISNQRLVNTTSSEQKTTKAISSITVTNNNLKKSDSSPKATKVAQMIFGNQSSLTSLSIKSNSNGGNPPKLEQKETRPPSNFLLNKSHAPPTTTLGLIGGNILKPSSDKASPTPAAVKNDISSDSYSHMLSDLSKSALTVNSSTVNKSGVSTQSKKDKQQLVTDLLMDVHK